MIAVSRRYAKALLGIGLASKSADALGRDLERIDRLVGESRELAAMLENPVFPPSRRRAVLEEIVRRLGLAPVVRNFLLLLLDRGRISSLADVRRQYVELLDEAMGRVQVTITSATPLDLALEARVRAAIERRTGKQAHIEKRTDPELVGGLVCRIGDLVLDGSVKTHLANLRERLLAG